MNKAEKALAAYAAGAGSAQAVFGVYAQEARFPAADALRIAAPFGGGMGNQGRICGAVSGALMALGLLYGNRAPGETVAKERALQMADEFLKRFEARNGALECEDLLGMDIRTPEGLHTVRESGIQGRICRALVRGAVEIVEQMREDARTLAGKGS